MAQEMMKSADTRLIDVACPICGDQRSVPLFETTDYSFGCSKDRFVVRRCLSCGCGYLSQRPLEEDMAHYYPPAFYWSWEQKQQAVRWQDLIELRRAQLEAKATWLEDLKPGRLLDVGAQKGEFLWYMQQRGWRGEGVEIDSSVPNPAGLSIRYGDILTMDLEPAAYDCITLWAVLEHVYRPASVIERAAALLRPGGRLVILVTNLHSIQARWFRADDYPRHLTIFTRRSLKRVLRNHGFEPLRFHTGQEIFGGALNGGLVYLTKRLGGYSVEDAFAEWKQPNDPLLFWTQWRGQPSNLIRLISRVDRAVTWPVEKLLDHMGFGFILTVAAEKRVEV